LSTHVHVQACKLIAAKLTQSTYFEIGLMAEKYKAELLVLATAKFMMAQAKDVDWGRVVEEIPGVAAAGLKMAIGPEGMV
jgi:hypothetical protein